MLQSSVDRIKAEISTSQLKMSWSVITGNLESIVSFPDNYEWVGKSNINIDFQNRYGDKINYRITDLDFSEYYDEKSSGILQTLYLEQNRIKILYYLIHGAPVIFVKYELLQNTPLPPDSKFIPFYFNLNKMIKKIEVKTLNTANHGLSYIRTDTENTLIFYIESGIKIDIINSEVNELQTVFVEIKNDEVLNPSKTLIKLPTMYIGSIKNLSVDDIQAFHNKIIDSHDRYKKWVHEKNK